MFGILLYKFTSIFLEITYLAYLSLLRKPTIHWLSFFGAKYRNFVISLRAYRMYFSIFLTDWFVSVNFNLKKYKEVLDLNNKNFKYIGFHFNGESSSLYV